MRLHLTSVRAVLGARNSPGLASMLAETQDLLVLHCVVKHANYAKAADDLGLSASGVSRAISRLEERLGVRLVQRTTRKLSLTEAGRAFHARAAQFLEGLTAAEQELQGNTIAPRGHLRVGGPVGLGQLFLAPSLSRFAASCPGVTIELKLSDGARCLEAEGMDLLIRFGALEDTPLVARRLWEDRRLLVAAPAYLARYGAPETVEALAQHRCLVFTGFPRQNEWILNGPLGQHRVEIAGPIATNNAEVLLLTAKQGFGIAMASTMSARRALRVGDLQRVLPEYEFAPAEVYAYYPAAGARAATVRSLLDFLLVELRHADLGVVPVTGGA